MASERAVIELRRVSRRFEGDPPVDALREVDLVVTRRDSVAIVGPSGSGKSTLLNVLGCLDRPTAGTYEFEGIDVAQLTEPQRATLRGRRIGFVFQSFHLLAHRSAVENVMLSEVYVHAPRAGRRERALATLDRVGLAARADYLPGKLSGGERQRVAIARALLGSPPLLLCDEPTGNLDSRTTETVLGLIDDLRADGLTVLMITHDDTVAAHASRVVRIIDGQLSEPERSDLPGSHRAAR